MNIDRKIDDLVDGAPTGLEKLERIFYYVRDGILFDLVPDMFASPEYIMEQRRGSCMNKAIVLGTMAGKVGFNVRYHFMKVSKQALKDFLHPLVFMFYPREFYHTYAEIEIGGRWVSMEPTFDRELHEICLRKNLNFARNPELRNISIDFSPDGVIGAQQYTAVKGGKTVYGTDLSFLQESLEEIPRFKLMIQPWAFRISSRWLNNTVRDLHACD